MLRLTVNIIVLISLFNVAASLNLSQPIKVKTSNIPKPSQIEDQDRIIGGYNASIEDFTHQVGLYTVQEKKNNNAFFCGGSIISHRFILTAAHCRKASEHYEIVIRAGSSRIKQGTIIYVNKENFIIHPEYNHNTADKDVGLIRTEKPMKFTKYIWPIKLPRKGMPLKAGSIFTVSGWGMFAPNHYEVSKDLMAVQLPVIDSETCWTANHLPVIDNMWCGGALGSKGICLGDSGGAAIQGRLQIGIVSWFVPPCGSPNRPDGFTYIAAPDVRNFIKKHTGL